MANHKRKRPKNRRGGCLYCKPHKANGCNEEKHSVRKGKKAKTIREANEISSEED